MVSLQGHEVLGFGFGFLLNCQSWMLKGSGLRV